MFKSMKDLIMFILSIVVSVAFAFMVFMDKVTSGELIGIFSLIIGYYFGSSSKLKI